MDLGISQRELAEWLGVSKSTNENWEANETAPRPSSETANVGRLPLSPSSTVKIPAAVCWAAFSTERKPHQMREMLVSDLVKEILGPRDGSREELLESPLSEYLTGVLAPDSEPPPPDVDAQAELPVEDAAAIAEDEADDADVLGFSPVLNPQARPRSIGLSFACTVPPEGSSFDVCLTWARYVPQDDAAARTWLRAPRAAILNDVQAATQSVWLSESGPVPSDQAEASFHVLARAASESRVVVSLYFVNRLRLPPETHATAEYHIYQPQIRVLCRQGARIVPGVEGEAHTEEDRELAFLYRNRPVLGRGHLCSVVWRVIDPQAVPPPDMGRDVLENIDGPPFAWPDAAVLSVEDRLRFGVPDIRTELVPLYPVQAPELDLPQSESSPPELRPEALAELWDSGALRDALEPLALRYENWIEGIAGRLGDLTDRERRIAERLIGNCRRVAARIRGGIDLLARDETIRLSFCFAMRAMALQAVWSSPGSAHPLEWRPFQLGFILTTLESVANPRSRDRDVADLLWVPTGAGKTEAYLALAAFTMAYRRRRALGSGASGRTGAGVSVISRYTLRLLTIQQFRRSLKMVAACECLRVEGLGGAGAVGWRPQGYRLRENFLWGSSRFAAGLWVGGQVTPNRLRDLFTPQGPVVGALTALERTVAAGSEPAQVLNCPACNAILSVPLQADGGLPAGSHLLHIVFGGQPLDVSSLSGLTSGGLRIAHAEVTRIPHARASTLSLGITSAESFGAEDVDRLWDVLRGSVGNVEILCARPSRPGYFFRSYESRNGAKNYDFEIVCPSVTCPLLRPWCEGSPAGYTNGAAPGATAPRGGVPGLPELPDRNRFGHVLQAFRLGSPFLASRIPIPAYTVDDQVYERCPSMVISTVDKFARPAFEPRAAALFGNVDHHHCLFGYYRLFTAPASIQCDGSGHPIPAGRGGANCQRVGVLDPPDLILQDELHLIEGPLGSLVGLYETAVDLLATSEGERPVKYLASTATVKQADEQVQAVFARRLSLFPPAGLTADDSFFVRQRETHSLVDAPPGRLHIGICAPGRGPLTPIVRIWARLLQSAYERRPHADADCFWTLVGYFNAIRELAGARALYRQDIPERLRRLAGPNARPIPDERSRELSGRMPSTELPVVLDLLGQAFGQDAVFTTSMFGTGVDIARLSLMLVHGQPKTTSSYIQATGRVGRRRGGLVAVFLRATRPRDLNHYEFFCGYHAHLHRFVEPITVMPFAPGALERGAGPVGVFILRNQRSTSLTWHPDENAPLMANQGRGCPEVLAIPEELERRAREQPEMRRPGPGTVAELAARGLDEWQRVAVVHPTDFRFVEYAINQPPTNHVVLGDPQHQHAGLDVVYRNAPQSLRDIEETCGFET